MASAGTGSSVEGIHAVAAAAAAGRVEVLYVEASRSDVEAISAIITDVESSGGKVTVVDDVAARATTSAPQGVVADTSPSPAVDIKDFGSSERTPAVAVLDHLEDPRNVGAIARTAYAAGFTGMVVASRRAAPLSASAFKAAAGALDRLPVAVVSSIPRSLEVLKSNGLWIVGLDAGAEESIMGLELLTEPVAVVVGAEGDGISRLAGELCDVVVKIPMAAPIESLNASAAAGIACFEVARSRGWVT